VLGTHALEEAGEHLGAGGNVGAQGLHRIIERGPGIGPDDHRHRTCRGADPGGAGTGRAAGNVHGHVEILDVMLQAVDHQRGDQALRAIVADRGEGRQITPEVDPEAGQGQHVGRLEQPQPFDPEAVAIGEGEHRNFYEIIEASEPFGWMTFDQSILNAYENDQISEETARLFATRKGRVSRGIDQIQKARGVDNDLDSGLRLDLPANAFR